MIVLEILGWFFLLSGSVFSVIGGIGLIRLPEFFSRMHGGGITDTLGAGLVVLGLILLAGPTLVAFKLVIILFFLTITSPSSCHALAKSAIAHGLQPQLDVVADSVSGDSAAGDSVSGDPGASESERVVDGGDRP